RHRIQHEVLVLVKNYCQAADYFRPRYRHARRPRQEVEVRGWSGLHPEHLRFGAAAFCEYGDPLAGITHVFGFDNNILAKTNLAPDDLPRTDQEQCAFAFTTGSYGHRLPGCRIGRQFQLGSINVSDERKGQAQSSECKLAHRLVSAAVLV